MLAYKFLISCLLCLCSLVGVQCGMSASSYSRPLKFLFVPILGNSPAIDMMGVAAQLRSRGHAVAVVVVPGALPFMKQAVTRYSDEATADAIEYIAVDLGTPAREAAPQVTTNAQRKVKPYQQRFTVPQTLLGSLTAGLKLLLTIQDSAAVPCSRVLSSPDTLQRLRSFAPDVVMALGLPISSGAASDSCGCLLSHALGAPLIDVMGVMWSGPSSIPQFGSGLSAADLKSTRGYLQNLATWSILQLRPLLAALRKEPWLAARQRLGLPGAASSCKLANAVSWLKGVRRFEKCESLLDVVLGSWVLEHPRRLRANQVLVGPGTPRPAHPITTPPDVASFVSSAHTKSNTGNDNSGGLILVAFGTSFAFTSWLSKEDFEQLALGFGALAPVRVLWNLQEEGLPHGLRLTDLPLAENTKVVDWVDYNDVLGHPATRLLISHCGLHSVYEAGYHGVPVIGVPFMFEQAENCAKLAARGVAVLSQQAAAFRRYNDSGVSSNSYTSQHVTQLIVQVLRDASYAAAARRMSGALQAYAAARHPYARAADEVELALYSLHARQRQAEGLDQQQPEAKEQGDLQPQHAVGSLQDEDQQSSKTRPAVEDGSGNAGGGSRQERSGDAGGLRKAEL